MRLFVLLLLFSFSASASELETHLQKRADNYTLLRQYYSVLLANINVQNDQLFCQNVRNGVSTLEQIFADDVLLKQALRISQDPDVLEFAQHIEDNSYSPLFSSRGHLELCDQQNRQTILRMQQSLQYHVMNVDYLSMSNLLFWQSISTQTIN